MLQFYNSSTVMANLYREDYTHEDYMQLVINAIRPPAPCFQWSIFPSLCVMLGQVVEETNCNSNMLDVNVSEWSEGICLLKVETAEGIATHRVTVVH